MELTTVGAKMADEKTPETYSSARNGKSQKEYIPEDPDSDPNLSDSFIRPTTGIINALDMIERRSTVNARNRIQSNYAQSQRKIY